MNIASIITADGNISLLYNNRSYSVGKSHPNYGQILEVLSNKVPAIDEDGFDYLDSILDIPKSIGQRLTGVVVTENGEVTFNGSVIHNAISTRIVQFMQQGIPFAPLAAFLENLMQNPSGRAVNELYGFLEHAGMPITEDGCFIAYKGIRDDWLDCYSGSIDNSVGKVVEFPRNKVDDNCNNTCSYGLHVGTLEYASPYCGSGGRVVLVKVNPADAISVPTDHNAQKLRVCRYEVIAETPERKLLEQAVYASPVEDCEGDDSWEDNCPDCGEYESECYCEEAEYSN